MEIFISVCSKSTGNVTQAPYCMCFISWSNSRCTAFVMMGFICMHLSKNTSNVSYDYMGRGSLLLPSWSSITLYTKNKTKVLQKCIVKWMLFLMQLRLHVLLHETNPISPAYAFINDHHIHFPISEFMEAMLLQVCMMSVVVIVYDWVWTGRLFDFCSTFYSNLSCKCC